MDYSKLTLFKMMQTKMGYHSERQDVLSQNVANADTPGYRPRDLEPLDFERALRQTRKRLEMRQTSPEHQSGTFFKDPEFRGNQVKKPFEIKPVKNAVSVEEQMMMMSHNAFEFQTTTTLYRKTAEMFKTAIGNR